MSKDSLPSEALFPAMTLENCSFCRIHAAKTWSDPQGSVTIYIADPHRLSRYRFALRTADFFVCRDCGAYLGAVLEEPEGECSTVNLRLGDVAADAEAVTYGSEDPAQRLARRKRIWTPTTIHINESRGQHVDPGRDQTK
jgi:hypothetical protein